MKKKIFSIIVLFVLTISVATKTHAEDIVPPTTPEGVNINLVITTPTSSLYNQNINVTACDSDNPSTSTVKVTAYCAILQSGLSSDWNFTWAPGIFLNSISDITGFTSQDSDGNDVYHYWSWSLNSVEAQVGLNQYELQPNDIISLTFIDPVPVVPVAPTPIEEVHHGSSGSRTRIIAPIKIIFDSKKAFDFLISKQKENGSFGEDLYTDWVSIALGSMSDYPEQKTKLINYLKSVQCPFD